MLGVTPREIFAERTGAVLATVVHENQSCRPSRGAFQTAECAGQELFPVEIGDDDGQFLKLAAVTAVCFFYTIVRPSLCFLILYRCLVRLTLCFLIIYRCLVRLSRFGNFLNAEAHVMCDFFSFLPRDAVQLHHL